MRGVDYFRHDGVAAEHLHRRELPEGPADRSSSAAGRSLSVGLTDAIFDPLAARRVVAARQADLQTARNDVLLQVAQAFFNLQAARGRLLGLGASIAAGRAAGELRQGAGPEPDRPAGDQPGPDRAPEPAADPAGGHPRLAGRQRPAGGGPAARPDHAAGADRAAVPPGHARPLRPDARGTGAGRREQSPRDRLAARAGRRGRAAPPPREESPVPAQPVRHQPDDVHRAARGRQPLLRPQRAAQHQRLAAWTSSSPRSGSSRTAASATSG